MIEIIRKNPIAFAGALLVHLLLVGVMLFSFEWPHTLEVSSAPKVDVVQAVMMDESLIKAEAEKLRLAEEAQRKAEEARQRELQRQADKARQQRLEEERREQQEKLAEAKKQKKIEQQRLEELKKKQEQEAVQREELKREQMALEKKKQEEQKRLADLAQKKKREEERQRVEKEKQRKAEEAERKRIEAEKQRKAEAERQRLEAEKQRKAEEERKRKEAEAKLKAEQEAKRKADEEARRAEERLLLQEQMAAEEALLEGERKRFIDSEVARYTVLIMKRVASKWVRPSGWQPGISCVVNVQVVPGARGGQVLDVKVIQSCGQPMFDSSVKTAVFKAEPLPLPKDPEIADKFRDLNFKFNPEE